MFRTNALLLKNLRNLMDFSTFIKRSRQEISSTLLLMSILLYGLISLIFFGTMLKNADMLSQFKMFCTGVLKIPKNAFISMISLKDLKKMALILCSYFMTYILFSQEKQLARVTMKKLLQLEEVFMMLLKCTQSN